MLKLVILFAVCSINTADAGENSPLSDQMIDIGTHRLQIHREGHGIRRDLRKAFQNYQKAASKDVAEGHSARCARAGL